MPAAMLLLGAVGQLACSQPAPEPTVTVCGLPDATNPKAKTSPSFRRDIQPTFAISCALSTACHGTDRGAAPQHRPLLGPKATVAADDAMLSTVLADLLQPSEQAPGLARVKPGRPHESFLVHKLEGTQGCGAACPSGCGGRMPLVGDPLPPEQIAQIRDWILQGAENN